MRTKRQPTGAVGTLREDGKQQVGYLTDERLLYSPNPGVSSVLDDNLHRIDFQIVGPLSELEDASNGIGRPWTVKYANKEDEGQENCDRG